jgi:hypothetical protein
MSIVLRLIKGSELSFAELDGNFTDLDNRTDALEALNLGTRVTRLEAAGTPLYYDSDDTEVILDSIWGGTVASYLATTDSIGLASFDSSRFSLTDGHVSLIEKIASVDSAGLASFDSSRFSVLGGHVSLIEKIASTDSAGLASFDSSRFTVSATGHVNWIERLATKDSDGTASFDSSNFVVTNGHVTINPLSAAGRVAGVTPIDSTGVASFDTDDFNVSADGHVTLVGGGTGAGAVGTYAFLTPNDGTNPTGQYPVYAFGDTAAGSLLRPTNAAGNKLGSPQTGTWQCMGTTSGGVIASEIATLWVRIS